MEITDIDRSSEMADADRLDPFVKGAAIGAAVVLVGFLLITAILYFSADYDFATPIGEGEPAGVAPAQLDGFVVAEGVGCFDCHTVTGDDLVGPTWQGLIGRERTFEDGSTVVADASYVRESIVDPQLHIVAGFPPVMTTSYAERMTEAEIDAVVAYIGTLAS